MSDDGHEDLLDASAEPRLLDSPVVRVVLIYLLPAVVCLLAGSAIYVARLSVEQDVSLMAQPVWRAGGRAAVRVLVHGPTGQLLDGVGVTLSLHRQGEQEVELGAIRSGPGLTAVDLDVRVPGWSEGPAELQALVETSVGVERVAAPLRLLAEPRDEPLYLPPRPRDRIQGDTRPHDVGQLFVELLPLGPGLVPNLDGALFIRTTSNGAVPSSAVVGLELVGGSVRDPLPETVRTDGLGLALLVVHARSNDLTLEVFRPELDGAWRGGDAAHCRLGEASPDVSAAGAGVPGDGGPAPDGGSDAGVRTGPPRATIAVCTTPAGLVLRLASPAPEAERALVVGAESLHAARPLFLDAYSGGRWVAARTGVLRGGRTRLELPRLPTGLVLLQGYVSPVEVGRGYSARHLYLRGAGEDDGAVLGALARRVRELGVDREWIDEVLARGLLESRELRFERAAAFLLSRLDRGYVQPTCLVSSRTVRSAELEAFQQAFKWRISVAIFLVGVVVSLLLAYGFAVSAFRARQRRLLWDATTGAHEDDLYVTSMGRPRGLDRFRNVVQIALMVGVVAVGFLLMAVLVSVMSWHGL